jgi:WD40 repeat protein/serine/threonine protein kinase
MSNCPFCNADLSESPLRGGRCPTCGNVLTWDSQASFPPLAPVEMSAPQVDYGAQPQAYGAPPLGYGAPPAGYAYPQGEYTAPQYSAPAYSAPPGAEYGTPPANFSAPPEGYSAPAQDPLAALKATMARIVNRGAREAHDGTAPLGPSLLPPGAGMSDIPAASALVAPLHSADDKPIASPSDPDSPAHKSPPDAQPPASYPTPISPRSYPTPRGNIDRTIELMPSTTDTNRATPVDISIAPLGSDGDDSRAGGATIEIPPPKQKQPSTFDDRRFAQTMESGAIAAEDTEQVAKLWRGTFSPSTTPRTSLKGMGGPQTRDSKLVIKHRALRDVHEPTGDGADYQLLSVIGEGGMGVVYAARQAAIDRTVAIKMLKSEIARDVDQREKFLSEAVVTGDLDHPNIVPIYDLGSNETGALFYSMKRVQGTPWMSVIDQKSNAENIDVLMKVADAVAFAHSRGVIHRDLKPENVMLGDFGEVLVMDWGLALSMTSFRKSGSITQTSSMGGTPAYMAPEMATGPIDRVGPVSDVYLLGAILYEIIAKKPPHTGKNVMNCLFAAAKNEIQPTTQSGELLDIAMKAMATKMELRYPSVQEFQGAIRQYQSHSESIVLSTRAQQDLDAAEKSGDYQTYSRALFAFQEAAALWDGNTKARSGVSVAKLAYARRAMKKEDLDLAASLIDASDPSHAELHRQVVAAQRERDTRQQRLKNVRRMVAAMGVAIVFGAGIGTILINAQKNRAVTAEATARTDRDNAVRSEQVATAAKAKADASAAEARRQAELARLAEGNARSAEGVARNAQKQATADADRAQQAKKREEYQAYVARIGLAAAQIEGNAFDTAEQLLNDCPVPLRDWEWGRLRFLSTQSVEEYPVHAPVVSIAFDRDGKKFVSGSWDGKARVWDAKTGKILLTIPYGALYVHSVAFSPDGQLIAAGGSDPHGYVKIFNANTGALVRTLYGHTDDVLSVAFSNGGRRLLTSSYDKTARLWIVDTGELKHTFLGHNWWVWSAAFSPDESQIVTASQDGTAIVWGTESGEARPAFTGHTGPVYTAAFSPDGQSVASGGYDNRVLIWKPDELQRFDYSLVISRHGANPPPIFRALDGHTGPVHTVAFSDVRSRDPADKRVLVLSGSNDNTIKLWDFATGKLIKTLRGHGGWVDSAVFSPAGHSVLSASHDTLIKRWNIKGYEEVRVLQGRVLQGHTDAVLSATCSRDGKRILTASRDRTAKMWDAASGQLLQDFEEGHEYLASTAAFFPDGKRLLTAAADNTTRIWEIATGTQLLCLNHTGRSSVAVVSHDGRLVLTGSDDSAAHLWNAETGKQILSTPPQKTEVTAVAFSPDDSQFFVGDLRGHCTLWSSQSGQLLHSLDTHTGKITGAQFIDDGRRILTASADRTVGQWVVATNEEPLQLILKHPGGVAAVAAVPHTSQAITLGDDGLVRLWDTDHGQLIRVLGGDNHTDQIGVSPDGRFALWVSDQQRTVRVWSFADGRELGPAGAKNSTQAFLTLPNGLIWSAAFSPDSHYLVSVGGNGARLWDVATGKERMSFTPDGAVASAHFSPDGTRIVTGSWDNSARIWSVATGKAELKLVGHGRSVNSAEFSPDGKWVLTGSEDATARIWDAKTGKFIRAFVGHQSGVSDAKFSPDGRYVLTASSDKTARLWDTQTGKQLHVYRGHEWGLLSAAFSKDGTRIVTGSADKTAKIWDVDSERLIATLAGHTAAVTSVAFSPDGRRIITGSQDETAKLWDAGADKDSVAGKEILTLKGHTQEVTSVEFSSDGSYVLTGSRDGTAIIWLASDWKTGNRMPNGEAQVTKN